MNSYREQARNNIIGFLKDDDYWDRKEVFERVVNEFENRNVSWALGCSMNLFFRGIVDDFNDIDIITDRDSVYKVKNALEDLGAKLVMTGGNGFCESDYYYHYTIGRVDIDVISGFRVMTYNTEYYFCYKAKDRDYVEITDDLNINLLPLEALYVLYYMMEGWQPRRRFKRELIAKYLNQSEVLPHKSILEEALKENLPSWIRWDIMKLLSK